MLAVRDLHAYYGKSHILQGVDLEVRPGEIVSLLGRNGVGRSTTCKAIMGLVEPVGAVLWKGASLAGLRPDQIAHAGIGYVPEDRQIFPTLTVRQNLELGLKRAGRFGRWSFDDIFAPRYNRLAPFGKPIIVTELGVSGTALRQTSWLANARSAFASYPQLRGVLYFEAPNPPVNHLPTQPDWRLAPDARVAFQAQWVMPATGSLLG